MKLKAINPGSKQKEYLLTVEQDGSDSVHEVEVFDHGGIRGVSFRGELRELQHKNPIPFKSVVTLIIRFVNGENISLPYDFGDL